MINLKEYKLLKELTIKDIESKLYYLEHNLTKAKVVVIENDDVNKAFTIGFKTPPTSDTGVCHIIEHTVLSGSKKYPVKEPFLELLKYSLNTFLNAMTYPDRTIYPVSSCNLKDFENLMDIYLDAVFNPLIYTKEELFKQEGWHYELASPNDPIKINGIVYNEMKGAFSSPDEVLGRLVLNSLFPNTCYQYESGGDPKAIPNLTYQDFLNFHKEHYHPSNSVIVLYGKMDYSEKLAYIDKEYLSKYAYQKADFPVQEELPFKEMKVTYDTYQLSPNRKLDDETYLSLGIAFPKELSLKERVALGLLTTALFEVNGAPIEQALLDKSIGKVVNSYYSSDLLQPFLEITVENSEDEKADLFIKTLDEEFSKTIKEGVNKKSLKSIISKALFNRKEKAYGRLSRGIIYAMSIIPALFYGDESFEKLAIDELYQELMKEIDTDFYNSLVEKYLLNNKHRSLVILKPSKTKSNEEEAKLNQELADLKETKTKAEILDLVKQTESFNKYLLMEDTKEDLAKIPTLKLSDIDDLKIDIKNVEAKIGNVKVVKHPYETSDILHFDLMFDLKDANICQLKKLALINSLLFDVTTKAHKYKELAEDLAIYIGRIDPAFQSLSNNDKTYYSLRFSILKENLNEAFALINEVLFTSQFDEKQHIKELITSNVSSMESSFAYRGNALAMDLCQAQNSAAGFVRYNTSGLGFYNYLKETLANFDESYDSLMKEIKANFSKVLTQANLIVSVTCNDELYQLSEKYLKELIDNLPLASEPNVLEFKEGRENYVVKTSFDVNFCAKLVKLNHEFGGSRLVLTKILNTDYLWKKVRVKGGAYGASMSITKQGVALMSSYRDPNLDETLNVYQKIANYIDDLNLTKEEIDKYIIGTIGDAYFPKPVRTLGNSSMDCYLTNIKEEDLIREKNQILNTTLSSLKEYATYFKEAKDEIICVLTNKNSLAKAKTKFDQTIDLIK